MLLACAGLLLTPFALVDFAAGSWARTPSFRIEDAYKWLYQATRGGEHAVSDDTGPKAWLAQEWAQLAPPKLGEREVEALDPSGRVVRVNLRPYRARGGDRDMLLAVFVASAERFERSGTTFDAAWQALGDRLRLGPIGRVRLSDWRRVERLKRTRGYPPIHHSKEYEKGCAPAYRVVLGSLWDR